MIIGITGTLGAGKGTIVNFLIKRGFKHHSVREFLIKELTKKDLEINRDNMTSLANELRFKFGPSYIVEQLYNEAKNENKDCIIESIRAIGEVEALRKKGNFYLLAVDADRKIRYERILKRNSSTDNISFEKFCEQEDVEMNNDDINKQNLRKCIEMADYVFENNGSIEDLKSKIEEFIEDIKLN
ncbi:AAA family ATPase [Candidatus Woesearchaeota archaeon]|nr:AAA family ATPase [Candidatus Woesearchaeota archaeon]